jgi:FTR1 family protein
METLARMLEATVVTLREGIEAALVVGIVLAYLRRTGRAGLERHVYWGLGAALVASLAAAAAIRRFGLDPENEVWEGSLMLVAAALVGSLVIWMWRTGRRIRQQTEARLEKVGGLGLFGFTFLMVFREGVETVLFLTALSGAIGANPLYNALGGGLGLLLAGLFGFLLVQGSLRVNLGRFFGVTGLVLLLLVAKLIANGLHEFFEAGLLPSTEALLAAVGFLTRESTSVLVLVLLIALPAGLLLEEALRRSPIAPLPGETPVEGRKRRAEARASRLWTGAAGVAGLTLSLLLILSAVAVARGYDPPPTPLALSGPILRIPVSELGDHPMRKYTVSVDGVSVRFFVARRQGEEVAVAFDACGICPLKGYHLVGDQVVCRNCDAPISFDSIGVPGGCNPIPLKAAIEGGEIVIRVEDLTEGRARFAKGA